MALINFDCPECGHNLEVDEGGAGFIIKCPECANPLQIPGLPRSHRYRKIAMAATTLLAILLLFASNLFLWSRATALKKEMAALQPLGGALQQAQAISMQQEAEIERLRQELDALQVPAPEALGTAALAAIAEAESLASELEAVSEKLLSSSNEERTALLRDHMRTVVEASKNSLPSPPEIKEAPPGRGIQGRQIIFPVLPGRNGQILRENTEITGVVDNRVSVKFAGGSATYHLTELHPGVAAYLQVDPLLVLPERQRDSEARRIQQLRNAERDQRLAGLRQAIEAQLPAETP